MDDSKWQVVDDSQQFVDSKGQVVVIVGSHRDDTVVALSAHAAPAPMPMMRPEPVSMPTPAVPALRRNIMDMMFLSA